MMNIEEIDPDPLIIHNAQTEDFKEESFSVLYALDIDNECRMNGEDEDVVFSTAVENEYALDIDNAGPYEEDVVFSTAMGNDCYLYEKIQKIELNNNSESYCNEGVVGNGQKRELRIVLQRCDFGSDCKPNEQLNITSQVLKGKLHPTKDKITTKAKERKFSWVTKVKKKGRTSNGMKTEKAAGDRLKLVRRKLKTEPKKTYYKKKKKIIKNPTRKLKNNTCTWCDLNCRKLADLKRHQGPQNSEGLCTLCSKTFEHKCQLRRHHQSDHPGENKRFPCPECEMKFISSYDVRRHVITHTKTLPFKCPECEKRFRRDDHLTAHMKVVHPKEFDHVCDMCEAPFKDKFKLAKHITDKHSGEGLFKCPHCDKSLNSRKGMKRHIATHTETKKFICGEKRCGKAFLTQNELSRHSQRHETEKPFTCEYCKGTFKTKSDVTKHENRTSCRKKFPFKCVICKKGFKILDKLREHEMTHTGKNRFKCDTADCRKFFRLKSNLIAHKESVHGEKPQVEEIEVKIDPFEMIKQCQPSVALQRLQLGKDQFLQPKWFKYLNGFSYLKKCIVKNAWYWRCSELRTLKCGATLIEDLTTGEMHRGLRKHCHPPDPKRKLSSTSVPEEYEKVAPTEDIKIDIVSLDKITGELTDGFFASKARKKKIHRCSYCARIFGKKSTLVSHKRTHTGEKPFTCSFCGRTFAAVGSLITHRRMHTQEKPYKCLECDYRARNSNNVKSHVLTHHTPNKPKPYKCKDCGKAFALKSFLTLHIRSHTGERPYECEICKKRFGQSSGLLVHRRTHSSEKPHKCNLCDYAAISNYSLKRHQQLRHSNKKPYKCRNCPKKFNSYANIKSHCIRKHFATAADFCEEDYVRL